MRHARAGDLVAHEELLASLRGISGLRERTVGSFYRRGSGFCTSTSTGTGSSPT